MPDYSKSSNKPEVKEGENAEKPEKRIEKVVTGEVVLRKKGIGRKTKDLIVSADLKGVAKYLLLERVLPNIRVMIYDAWVEGGNRVMFPGAPKRPMVDPRSAFGRAVFNYNGISSGGPLNNRGGIPMRGDPRMAPNREIGPRASSVARVQSVRAGEQYLFMDKDDAARVIATLREALDKYETPISIADLYEAMGQQSPNGHVDQKWGWTNLANVKLLQSSEGFILDFPPSEQIA